MAAHEDDLRLAVPPRVGRVCRWPGDGTRNMQEEPGTYAGGMINRGSVAPRAGLAEEAP